MPGPETRLQPIANWGAIGVAAYNKLEGELVTLKRIQRAGWPAILERFQTPELYDMAGLKKAPEQAALFEDLDEDELLVFDIVPHEGGISVGYAVFVHYDGPPYVFTYFFSGELDIDFASDAILQMVLAFFQYTEEPRLYTFLPKPVPDDIHDRLLEGGFDHVEDYPVIDNDEETCYCLERFTYEAYYQDEADDEVEELEF